MQNAYSVYDGMTVVECVEAMHKVALAKEKLEEQLKVLNKEYDFLRITKVPEKMQDEGIERLTVAGVGRVSLTADMHVSVKADQRERFFEWLRDNGRSELLQETINPSTLKAAVKKMYRSGEDVPEDLLNVSPFTRASITQG
jgi:hypothetical protein